MNRESVAYRSMGSSLLIAAIAEVVILTVGPYAATEMSLRLLGPIFLAFATGVLGAWVLLLSRDGGGRPMEAVRMVTEVVLAVGVLLFLFRYIFAANANMGYVQRFIQSGGNIDLATDTSTERTLVALRYGPSLVALLLLHVLLSVRSRRFDLLLTLLSVGLSTLALPSAIKLSGIGALGWLGIVPLLLVLRSTGFGKIIFYGVTYGVLTTVTTNFWLGTFSLVSLSAVTVIYLVYYALFMTIFGGLILLFRRSSPMVKVFLTAAIWTGFEYIRSVGFLAYPWGLIGHTQYTNLPLIQLSELTGVWGVTFVVVLFAAALAEFLGALTSPGRASSVRSSRRTLLSVGSLVLVVHLVGWWTLGVENRYPKADKAPRVALVQQNSDPRKHEYERTFQTLTRLTDAALRESPDIVIWSETAFVPNIRRWGEEDPKRYRLAELVERFRSYQKRTGTWLLTGNDDYRRVLDDSGTEIARESYNAAVLFTDAGDRRETYHKMKLVPFTEYFPYKEELPFIYNALKEFDVSFWTPGERATVFEHPAFTFSTPICFEDVFPNGVRRFVLNGADVVVNITNDYWSLTEVQAQQHFAASLFRAVENRRPFLRASASGVTAHVDPYGRVVARLPQYQAAQMVTEVPISSDPPRTIYTRWGDWFPKTLMPAVLVILLLRFRGRGVRIRGGHRS